MNGGAAPILLVSMPQMMDPNFARTVVLLCDYTEEGAFGLVVNRPMSEPAWQMVKTEPPVRVDPDLKLWMGGRGPAATGCVITKRGADEEQREICRVRCRVARGPCSDADASLVPARVLVGYAGGDRAVLRARRLRVAHDDC